MTSHALYWWHHMHYIWHVIYCVWYHIHFMCGITQCLYLWYHTLSVYDISILFGITHSVITTQPLCIFRATMSDITPTVSVSSHPVDQFYHTQFMCDITDNMCMTSYALHVTSHSQFRTSHHFMYDIRPLYMTSLPLYLCHHTMLSMILQTLYVWPHIQYICDITSIILMT